MIHEYYNTNQMVSSLKDHLDFLDDVNECIENSQFEELLQFTNFSLCKLMYYGLIMILENNNKTVIKHVINNMSCINMINESKWSLIHYLARYLIDADLMNYFIEKHHFDLQFKTPNDIQPIHLVCRNKSLEMVNLLINEGVNLESEDYEKWRPIHFACQYDSMEIVMLLVGRGVNMESEDYEKWRPIHFACQYGSLEVVNLLVNNGVNLESEMVWKWKPVHIVCRYRSLEYIIYMFSLDIDLTSKIHKYDDAVADFGIKELLERNDKLTKENIHEILNIIDSK